MCETEETSGPVDVVNYRSLAVLQFAPHVVRLGCGASGGAKKSQPRRYSLFMLTLADFMDLTAALNPF